MVQQQLEEPRGQKVEHRDIADNHTHSHTAEPYLQTYRDL